MQRNFTDPDSRVLLTKDGFIQGYNAQAAVDAKQIRSIFRPLMKTSNWLATFRLMKRLNRIRNG